MAQYGVSFTAQVTAYDSTAGTMKTADAANIILYWNKDGTSGICATNSGVPTEASSGNQPGIYEIVITAGEATCTVGKLAGKSSTGTNIIITGPEYHFDSFTSVVPAGGILALGHVDAGTAIVTNTDATHIQLRAAAAFANSELVGHTIEITGGTGVGQSRIITANTLTNDLCTVDTWTTTPDGTSTYIIWPSAPGSTASPMPVNVVSSSVNFGIKKNTALAAFTFYMTDSTTHVAATGLTVTATRSLDGAAFGACANAVSEVASGEYKIDLAAADLNGATVMLKFTATGADQRMISIVTTP